MKKTEECKSVKECPLCLGETKVTDSRTDLKTGTIRRKRKCIDCGHEFKTQEIMADDLERIHDEQQREKRHELGFKIPTITNCCVGISVYIDRQYINAIGLHPLDENGKRMEYDGEMDCEIDVAELEVRDIEDIALVMNKETFKRFCELWRMYHGKENEEREMLSNILGQKESNSSLIDIASNQIAEEMNKNIKRDIWEEFKGQAD